VRPAAIGESGRDVPKIPRKKTGDAGLDDLIEQAEMIRTSTADVVRRLKELEQEITRLKEQKAAAPNEPPKA
jgi:hypothetical protein